MDRATVLDDYVQKILAAGRPEAIVLFGSEADNTANEDSDFDLLVIEHTAEDRRQRAIKYQMALRPRVVAADILVRTPEELRQAVSERHPVIREILQRGRWLYGESWTFGAS